MQNTDCQYGLYMYNMLVADGHRECQYWSTSVIDKHLQLLARTDAVEENRSAVLPFIQIILICYAYWFQLLTIILLSL